jgi:archaeosine-15-forming tRNA-guanine transglycosylase
MNQTKSVEECLRDFGWQEVTVREKDILQRHGAEGADDLHKAFEHKEMGTIYCYSEQEATAFLNQLEAHPLDKEGITQ